MDAAANCSALLVYDESQMARYWEGANSRYISSDALMREIYLRDNGTCQKCSRAVGPRAAHFDHIVPWSEDGLTVPWNLQILCGPCNWAKGNRMDDQDEEKRIELDATTWSARVLVYVLREAARKARLDDAWKPVVRDLIRDVRDMLDDLDRVVAETAQDAA